MKKVTYTNGAEFITSNPQARLFKDQAFWDKQRTKGKPARNPRPEIKLIENCDSFSV